MLKDWLVNFNRIARLVQKLPGRGRPIFLTCVYGLAAGLGAVAFQMAMNALYRATFVSLSHKSTLIFLVGGLVVIVSTSLAVGYLLTKFAPEASGSGIPQLKLAFWKEFGVVPFRVVWVKFIAGVLSIGGGCSLGREGPSVQLAGGLSSNLAGVLGEPKQKRRMAAAAGAAAGLAAAFNTPLAAVTFVLEEIIADLNSNLLGSVLLASVIGAFVVHGLIGKQPAFALSIVEAPGWPAYVFTPVVAAISALIGVVFQKWTMRLRARRKQFKYVPAWARPSLGGLATWALGSAMFLSTGHMGVFSLGYDDLSSGLSLQLGWRIAAALVGTKLLATVLCYGLGGCGGIFSPTLFLGGMCGLCLAGLGSMVLPLTGPDQITLAVVGMSACLAAVVRAPVTGILIVFEMTHEFSLVPALMLGALVSEAISRKLSKHSFYEEILLQDGHRLEHVVPPRDLQSWQQLPVSAIATFRPVVVQDLSFPELEKVLRAQPYQRFPVVQHGGAAGILTRKEAEGALAEKRAPKLEPLAFCLPHQTIRELQQALIESTSLMVLVLDQPKGRVLGLVTLHDLLRAEVAIAKEGAGP
ncbi:MAG TPA: chloride channel protein [Verrucomicrobiae bacterium]|nr:chloride channel protein [Verrucomicrobiae bacterium]